MTHALPCGYSRRSVYRRERTGFDKTCSTLYIKYSRLNANMYIISIYIIALSGMRLSCQHICAYRRVCLYISSPSLSNSLTHINNNNSTQHGISKRTRGAFCTIISLFHHLIIITQTLSSSPACTAGIVASEVCPVPISPPNFLKLSNLYLGHNLPCHHPSAFLTFYLTFHAFIKHLLLSSQDWFLVLTLRQTLDRQERRRRMDRRTAHAVLWAGRERLWKGLTS